MSRVPEARGSGTAKPGAAKPGGEQANVRARARITGTVQGVGFRYETRIQAEHRGVVGWVRNLRDGSVELVAEGQQPAVESLLAWCRRGPDSSRVEEVQVAWEPYEGQFSRFDITR